MRFVVTLDSDTRVPRDSLRRLIGKMAHPLNRPRFDPAAGRVVEGYGVLQPRVTPSLPIGREGSPFQRIFSSSAGIDPYVAAVSDVYQDLFGEGSYAGKGIYEVDVFEAALRGRVPDSTLLSHDLFEGIFARAGLASDVEVVEEFPRTMTSPPCGIIGGRAVTGSCCPASSGSGAQATQGGVTACPPSAEARCWTISAALCRRRPLSSRWSPAGRYRSRRRGLDRLCPGDNCPADGHSRNRSASSAAVRA